MNVILSLPVVEIITVGTGLFLFGACIGSFLNVVALRYNSGRNLSGRSVCASCVRPLVWFELIPVFSFIVLRGRCRTCNSLFSVQYPIVEFLTGFLFLLLFLENVTTLTFLYFALVFSLYIVIGIYDIRHTIVPDGLSLWTAGLAFLGLFVELETFSFALPSLGDLLAGPLIALPLFLLWFISSGKWMGLGDAKLTLSIGWLLGLSGGAAALLIAVWSGAIIGLFIILFSSLRMYRLGYFAGKSRLLALYQGHTMYREIPFAPFLLLGFFLVFFFDLDFLKLIVWYL